MHVDRIADPASISENIVVNSLNMEFFFTFFFYMLIQALVQQNVY